MLYFIPAWYKEDKWCENEQSWHIRRLHTEFDDTVKHIQLFNRSKAYPFCIMLLSFAPNFRHFLHRQSVFHAPYWSLFDSIQEIERKKVSMFSFHNLNWPEGIEFIYTPFVVLAMIEGKKYAKIEFGEDGNLIEIDIYKNQKLERKNIYDDRGFVGSTILYDENEEIIYQDYLNEKGIWKIRQFKDGRVFINEKTPTYSVEYENKIYKKTYDKKEYVSLEEVILEVLNTYIEMTKKNDIFCVAVHKMHMEILKKALEGRKRVLSFYGERYDFSKKSKEIEFMKNSDYIIADSNENKEFVSGKLSLSEENIIDITPFDSRVDLGISQQLSVQKIMVPIDGIEPKIFAEIVYELAEYMEKNKNARVHLFTRKADFGMKEKILQNVKNILRVTGFEEALAREEDGGNICETFVDAEEMAPVKFVVEQCVDELSVSKCMREQRLIVDMRDMNQLYLRITGISIGIPQILYRENQFLIDGKNGRIVKDVEKLSDAIAFYLENITNWNEAVVHAVELGKKYTTKVLIEKWKEVIDFVENN